MIHWHSGAVALLLSVTALAGASAAGEVADDAIDAPLTGRAGDPARGERLVADRKKSLCTLCHTGPFPAPHLHGNIAPDLTGVGGRLTEGQLRLRVADMKRLNPSSIMPAYGRPADDSPQRRVAAGWRGRPLLEVGDIEDLVAYLVTLKE